MSALHAPALRLGAPYRSLDVVEVRDARGQELLCTVSQANAGLITRDLRRVGSARAVLDALPAARIIELCAVAARHFMESELPLDASDPDASASLLGPEDYVRLLSASTGLPYALCRRNMTKIEGVLAHMGTVTAGLTRGLDLSILDAGSGEERGVPLSYCAMTDALAVVLPSNSPGVNSLWLPALALKIPVVLKPGRADPFTPSRIAAALVRAGLPREAVSIYPSDHAGSAALLDGCGRSLLFGDAATTARYATDPRVQRHGPGYSKVLFGDDTIADWPRYLDVLVRSIADNGGRSCVNASTIVVPRDGDALARALAERLAAIVPRAPEDPAAELAAFTDASMASRIDAAVEVGLSTPGAADLTADLRVAGSRARLVDHGGLRYLLPTLVRCRSPEHPLAFREFLFPFASVVEIPTREMAARIGPSLVVSAITRDRTLLASLERSPQVDRMNVGALPTASVRWDQPHEGNLFDFLYRRRAYQRLAPEQLPDAEDEA